MKTRRLIAILLACLFFLTACEGKVSTPPPTEEVSGGPVVSNHPIRTQNEEFALPYNNTATLDPLSTNDSLNRTLAGLVYEGLFQLDENFSAQPLLCADYTFNASRTVWSFTIRENTYFSDGTLLTPAHVAAALKTARSSPLYKSRLSQVTSVTSDQAKITITLSSPNGSLPSLLDIPITLSAGDGLPPLGTGPYFYFSEESSIMLCENSYYNRGYTLPADSIPLYSTAAADQRVAAFDSGLISLVPTDLSSPGALGYACNYETWNCPTTSMLYVIYQCRSNFCSDPILRQALSRCIDRDTVVEDLLAGEADSSALPVSPHSSLYNQVAARSLAYDPQAASELLAQNGYYLDGEGHLFSPKKKQVELNLLVNADNSYRVAIAQYLADDLSKLGITVHVTSLPWGSYMVALKSGSFDLCLAQTKLTADFNLSPLFTAEGLNYGLYEDLDENGQPIKEENSPTLALIASAAGATGIARILAYQNVFAHLSSVSPVTAICFTRTSALTRWGMVSNAAITQQNLFYQFHLWEFR